MYPSTFGAIIGLVLGSGLMAAEPREDVKPGEPQWKLGLQAWTYNRFTLFETIDKAKALGIRYLEAYPGQALSPADKSVKFDVGSPAEVRDQVKKKLKEAGVKLVNFGVVDVGEDEKSARRVFEFAKDMGIETIVAEPKPAVLDALDKLTQEYKINLAIHDHPKPSPYWDPQFVLKAVKGRNKRMGACADTGHWVRSGLDPVECLKQLEGRIISLHFKDLNEKKKDAHDVPWGTGISNIEGQLAELKRQGFSGVFAIEYEHDEDNPTPGVSKCVEAFNRFTRQLGVKLASAEPK
ncbi:MAG: hypothetical protein AMXMBFR83_13890 [Phycisphaerae bacterium]